MGNLLMPMATAVWLVDETTLTFEQIGDFCALHVLEIQGIADGDVATNMLGFDPIAAGQLTRDEITRCEADPSARLEMAVPDVPLPATRTPGPRYTPVTRRQDRPDAIAWLLKHCTMLTDGQISKLVGTTKPTIRAVADRTHWNMTNIKPQDPITLGMCTRDELKEAIAKAERAIERAQKKAEKEARKAGTVPEAEEAMAATDTPDPFSNPDEPAAAPEKDAPGF